MTSLTRWSPSFDPFRRFERDIDRFFRNFFRFDAPATFAVSNSFEVTTPDVNVWEDEQNVHVEAVVPGLSKDDLQLHLTSDRLTLRGQVKQESEKNGRSYHLREVRYGAFERAIPLPYEVNADKAKAELSDGILKVTLPKTDAAKAKTRKIEIKAA